MNRISYGILFLCLMLAILLITDLFAAPHLASHCHFHHVMEDDYSNDDTFYIPVHENKDFVSSYELKIDKKTGKRFLRLNYAKDFGKARLYIVLFDYIHLPYEILTVDIQDSQNPESSLIFLDSKARGTAIQFMAVDGVKFQKNYPVSFSVKRLIWSCVYLGFFNALALFFGYLSLFNFQISQYNLFEYYPIWYFVLICFLCFLFTGLGAFFLFHRQNHDYFEGGDKK